MSLIAVIRDRNPGVKPGEVIFGLFLGRLLPRTFPFLRRHCPVLTTRRFALVVRDTDVRQVLGRRDDFSVAHYTGKIIEVTGPFALGFDDETHYAPARKTIETAIRKDDPPRLAKKVGAIAEEAMDVAATDGRLDAISDFLDPVLARLAVDYLGLDGTDERQLFEWARTVFNEIFVSRTPFVRPPAMNVVQAFRRHIDALIRRRKEEAAGEAAYDDVLARLLAASVADDVTSGTLLGLVVAWIPNASRMLAMVLDELLNRPEQLTLAQEAARRGDDESLAAILFETARLRPAGPGVFRVAARTCKLGLDTRRPRTIRAGVPVLAATRSAMMDEEAVDAPEEFRLDRPWSVHLFFGYGLHTCAGEAINRATVPAIIRPLLAYGRLARAAGREGRLGWRYPFPAHLVVTVERKSELRGRGAPVDS